MNSEEYVTRNELQAAERLARTEAFIDSVLIVQQQNDRMIRYGTRIMYSLMIIVAVSFVGFGYQSIGVGKDIAALQISVSSIQTDVSSLQMDVSSIQTDVSMLREEFSEEIAGLRSEISSLKTMNGAVVHN